MWFGLARVAFSDTPTTIFWMNYVATRWYKAPELCGPFYSKYTLAIDIWSISCIIAEVLIWKPLFLGKNVVHQLDLITYMLGYQILYPWYANIHHLHKKFQIHILTAKATNHYQVGSWISHGSDLLCRNVLIKVIV